MSRFSCPLIFDTRTSSSPRVAHARHVTGTDTLRFPRNLEVTDLGCCKLYFVPVAAALLVGAVLVRPWPSLVTALHWLLLALANTTRWVCLLLPLLLLMLLFARELREHSKLCSFSSRRFCRLQA
ncbi:hypothetical protein M441DRAFT_368847 [Trichoderma asperellum CBS 433.97]|uniref:Uncharacterized protein n=1 Tax=Trichoderma asperellum (strain ATCC 204424 / CBS 433.97 / NBRC 101777) TaxID=1042311 RepID=A0A2T3ZEM5_TRIA4|nr:hypothetical protein M441DRAFT_368847 [Trichoderma asperellum CBS 433.97]PTB43256.1 hypothetical protein M441DRAFT_368847 [Trichoderma asperellum CBS 433.97]